MPLPAAFRFSTGNKFRHSSAKSKFPFLFLVIHLRKKQLQARNRSSMAWKDLGSFCFCLNFQSRMREVELGAHTVKSHGVTIARTHLHDWLILLLLGMIQIVLYLIHPFYRFVGKDMMTDLKYPLKDNTVPTWTVPVYAVLLPIAIFYLFYIRRRDAYDLHHGILGLLYAVFITGVITDVLKLASGQPRPNFFWRCFPDGKDSYDIWGNVVCHGEDSLIKEGHKSFPSGHASWSFAGLAFLSMYLSGKIKAFDCKGRIAKLCIVFLPLLIASLVAISRVSDYWHHWQDVFAGSLIGLVIAAFCYLQFFPPPYHTHGWGSYAYFRALEESRTDADLAHSVTAHNLRPNEVHGVTNHTNGVLALSIEHAAGSSLEQMELGRR